MDTQWEYKFFDCTTLNPEEKLNELGKENWEVVAAGTTAGNGSPNKLVLKRPKRQQTRKRDDDYGYGR